MTRKCIWCDTPFAIERETSTKKYCGQECGKQYRQENAEPCAISGCGSKGVSAAGHCSSHYRILMRSGGVSAEGKTKRRPARSLGESWAAPSGEGYLMYKPLDGSAAMLEHRWAMQQVLGRELLPNENVHHINGHRDDNRPENLELWSTSQPPGQRVEDKLSWAKEFLEQYGYEVYEAT